MKKLILWVLVLVMSISIVGVFSVSGCKATTEEEGAPAEEEAEEAAPAEEVAEEAPAEEEAVAEEPSGKVVLWTYQAFDADVIAKFNEMQSDIEVDCVVMGPWDMEDKLLTAIASGKGAPDAAMVVSRRFQRFAMGEGMSDLTGYLGDKKDDFLPAAINMGVYTDRVFALPLNISPIAMHYRKDLFEEYGLELPKTFDDLAKMKEKLPEGVFVLPLFLPAGQWGSEYVRVLLQMRYGEDGQIYDDNGKVIKNNSLGKETFEWLNNLVEEGIGYPTPWFTPEMYTDVKDGKVVMWITNISEVTNFQKKFPDMAGQWGTAPVPLWEEGADPLTGVWGNKSYCIPSLAKNPDAAYKVIEWLTTSDEALDMYVDTFTFPAYIPYLDVSEKLREPNEYLGGDVLIDVVNAREVPSFNFIDWVQTASILGQEIDAWYGGEKTTDEAWDDFEQRLIDEGLGISE